MPMPTLFQRVGAAITAFRTGGRSSSDAPFPGQGGGRAAWGGSSGPYGYHGTLPGTNLNVAQAVGDPTLNSAVSICLNWIADQFPEPELQVARKKRDGTYDHQPNHKLTALVNAPNPYYDGDSLWALTAVYLCVSGDAFWWKRRDNGGRVRELWALPWWMVFPRWDSPDSFLDWYEYRVNGGSYRFDPADIIHFRMGLDPLTRRGVSRLYPVLRNVLTDNECETFITAILLNMGIPAVIISPKEKDVTVDDEAAESLKVRWNEFRGDGRGKPMVPSAAIDVHKLTFNPNELALDKIRQIPEDRICAALRVPAMVVGLTSGAAHKTYANYREAREAAYEDCVMPLQTRLARVLDRQLLPEFEGGGDTEGEVASGGDRPREQSVKASRYQVRWDYEHVRCLQEDRDKAAKRLVSLAGGPILTPNEARAKYDSALPELEGGDELRKPQSNGEAGESKDPEKDDETDGTPDGEGGDDTDE